MGKIIKETLHAKGIDISIYTTNFESAFISLTDIAKYRNEDDPRFVVQNWMRNRNTIEFLGVWESLYNSDFNRVEFDAFRACLKNVDLPKRRVFSRHAGLIFLAIHQGLLRQIALPGEKIPRPWAYFQYSNKT